MVEAWGFRMMQERGHFADRYEVAKRWFEQEYVPVSDMLREGGLTEPEETEAEAYMRLAGQRYLLLRTHEWSRRDRQPPATRHRQEAPAAPAAAPPPTLLTAVAGSRVGMRTVFSFALGAATGAAAARLLTPTNGRKAASAASSAASAASTQAHHTANTVKGVAHAVDAAPPRGDGRRDARRPRPLGDLPRRATRPRAASRSTCRPASPICAARCRTRSGSSASARPPAR